jgi:hypothetical protein
VPGALEAVADEGDSTVARLLDNAPGSCTVARLTGLLAGSAAAAAAVDDEEAVLSIIVVGRYLEDTLLLWLPLRLCIHSNTVAAICTSKVHVEHLMSI